MADQLLGGLPQQLVARLLRRHAGDALEVAHLLLLDDLELVLHGARVGLAVVDALLAAVELLHLELDGPLAGEGALLDLRELRAALVERGLGLLPHLEHPLARFDVRLAAHRVGVTTRVGQQALGLQRVRRGACTRELLVHEIPGACPDQQASDDADHDQDLHCPLLCRGAGGATTQARSVRSAPATASREPRGMGRSRG